MSQVICLWASPRNISTALMYSFAQRKDVKVLDEPFYAYYLTHVNPKINHPGKKEILESQPTSLDEVLNKINSLKKDFKIIFIKNMTHHLKGVNLSFANSWSNIILTRNPQSAMISFSKVIQNPTMDDLGYELQYLLASSFKKKSIKFKIISSEELLKNPKEVLTKMCGFFNISFDSKMLSWKKGGIVEDGVWAPYWYGNVHNSEGFSPYTGKFKNDIPSNQHNLLEKALYYYQKLMSFLD
ncbi:sulfotransferase family protein [Flavobacteriales bacterium]|nr:sulfotransferase family protein [Flavobacteriales bacterium]